MATVHKRLLLAVLLVGTLAAGCDKPAAPDPAAATSPRVITITPSAPGASVPAGSPPAGVTTLEGQETGLPHAEGSIPGTTADSIARAWAKYWHATPAQSSVLGSPTTNLTVDFGGAHGKLFLTVGRQSADATAASVIYCQVNDESHGPQGFVTMTRKAVEELVAGCPGPALTTGEAKQVTDFVASHDKPDKSVPCTVVGAGGTCRSSDHRINLKRFQLVVLTSPARLRLYVLGRKGAD
jgi:hypothetical protein